MSGSTLIEVFGHIVFRFTRGVTEHYNPEEPEFTEESFGYDPFQSTGREWYYLPVDELIYQEYSDREDTRFNFLASSRFDIKVINACSPMENEETQENQHEEDKAMAWKRLRPPFLQTVYKSMYTGALVSLLAASILGTIYTILSYLNYKTVSNCEYQLNKLIPARLQWMITLADIISCVFFYVFPILNLLFLFRPYQIKGVKRKLILVSFITFFLDALYRGVLQAVGKPFFKLHSLYRSLSNVPVYIFVFTTVCLQFYFVARHLFIRPRTKLASTICKMAMPTCCAIIAAFAIRYFIYTAYNNQDSEGKLVIALFAPLMGVAFKAISRICVQRLWNITHPGYSYVLLAPLYCLLAVMFRVLQADLDTLESIAILGVIHGFAEVIERSTVVVIDHICHQICERALTPWGSFRTSRRERLMADIAIMSMLFESTAIVSVNGFLYLYQFIYLEHNDSLLKLLQSFAIHTSVPLVIEWIFTSVSLAIETRYQNMAVMAVWRRQWKRHILVAIVNIFPAAIWTSGNLLVIVHERFNKPLHQSCKMPFT
ncbi:uncharacterized protein LOC144641799 [Oculina patagonica]